MHPEALGWVSRHATISPGRILDIGGRDINGNPRHLFHPDAVWEVVDLHDGPAVTWVGDFLDYPIGDCFDVVLCLEVAEHTAAWPNILEHAAQLLAADGVLIFTAAGAGRAPHSAIDGGVLRDGEHYENIGWDALVDVLDPLFHHYTIDTAGTDIRAVAWRTR